MTKGDIENFVWLQDILLRKEELPQDSDFLAQLGRVLHHIHILEGSKPSRERQFNSRHLPPRLFIKTYRPQHPGLPFNPVTGLRTKWDFSRVRVQLVPSIAGKFEGRLAVLRFGHTRLMKAIRQIGARADPDFNKSLV